MQQLAVLKQTFIRPMARLRSRTNNHILFYDTIDDLLATDQVRSMSSVTQHVKDVTCLDHSIFVAYVTFRLCRFFHLRAILATRGALLHDMFLYDQHDSANYVGSHLVNHGFQACKNAARLYQTLDTSLSDLERDIIIKHMWPVFPHMPKYTESYIVNLADKVCTIAELSHLYHAFSMKKKLSFLTDHPRIDSAS